MMRCCLCGRLTEHPAVMIGREAVGPKCARKAGLTKLAKTNGRVIRFGRVSASTQQDDRQSDMFAEGAA